MTRHRHVGFKSAANLIWKSWTGEHHPSPDRQYSWLFRAQRPNSKGIGYGTGYEEDWRIALHEACYQIKLMERNGLVQFDESLSEEEEQRETETQLDHEQLAFDFEQALQKFNIFTGESR